MRIAMQVGYSGDVAASVQRVVDLENAGLDIAWVAEAYTFDAPTYMGYLAAKTSSVQIGAGILPIYTRTPTVLAMTAAGLDALSGGRCVLGLGASGPQVIEGFHGVPYDRPLARTREIVDICRQVWRREAPLVHEGPIYHVPLPADQGTGLGKALKIINHPVRPEIPIYIASLGEKNVELTAEVANGWLPMFFIPDRAREVFGPSLSAGLTKRDAALGPLDIAAGGLVAIGEGQDVRDLVNLSRPMAALYIGGMGARDRNFYNALVRRYGYESEAQKVQDLYLDGKKDEAAAAIPDELLELMNLCGPEGWIKERLAAFKEAGVTVLQIQPVGAKPTDVVEKLRAWST
jgi:F420-dependent oxidoreductase-like protein